MKFGKFEIGWEVVDAEDKPKPRVLTLEERDEGGGFVDVKLNGYYVLGFHYGEDRIVLYSGVPDDLGLQVDKNGVCLIKVGKD